MTVEQILTTYWDQLEIELEIDPKVAPHVATPISYKNERAMPMSEVQQELEKALREQAGVVIKHRDAKHCVVSYDPSEILKPKK
jgi:hypothetical protein